MNTAAQIPTPPTPARGSGSAQLRRWINQLEQAYRDLGLTPERARRSARADFLADFGPLLPDDPALRA